MRHSDSLTNRRHKNFFQEAFRRLSQLGWWSGEQGISSNQSGPSLQFQTQRLPLARKKRPKSPLSSNKVSFPIPVAIPVASPLFKSTGSKAKPVLAESSQYSAFNFDASNCAVSDTDSARGPLWNNSKTCLRDNLWKTDANAAQQPSSHAWARQEKEPFGAHWGSMTWLRSASFW